ncbi:MAG: helix-turn-helix transcriptional regulator [Selenomonadaceae bacterium]|nr:helix-turn-helix transcriptional regulator [Selenomonadaceae bacterium]MBR4384293.1 helix-turn-helix transcriptional regulator [Selenomonadaceae bacterium]
MDENLSFGQEDCRAELQCIGLRISYFRKLKKFTQAELADRLHINKNYLSHIESGSANKAVSLPLLIKISRALDVELSALVDLGDLHNSNFGEVVKDMRNTFEDLKQLNSELDKMMEQLN